MTNPDDTVPAEASDTSISPIETTPAVPAILTPPAPPTEASSLANRKKQFKAEVRARMLAMFEFLKSNRTDLRRAFYANAATLSAPQAWAAMEELGIETATLASKLDAFMEDIFPGCIAEGDKGVPNDYVMQYDPATGRATCTEKE